MTLQKPLQINFNPEKDLKTGTIHYFQTQLGFNFDNLKTSDLPISLQIKNQNYDLQIVFQYQNPILQICCCKPNLNLIL